MKKTILIGSILLNFTAITILQAAPYQPVVTVENGMLNKNLKPDPSYKVGTSYSVAGQRYTPKADYTYDVVGIASWYGNDFHGNLTANGEVFDKNQLTAAHTTLPMPSFVEVENLENQRKLVLRVNDRGPFSKDRVIDVSQRAAEILGFKDKGTAKVRVKILANISQEVAENLMEVQVRKYTQNSQSNLTTAQTKSTKPTPQVNKDLPNMAFRQPYNGNVSNNILVKAKINNDVEDVKTIALIEPTSAMVRSYTPKGIFVQVGAFDKKRAVSASVSRLQEIGVVTLQNVNNKNTNSKLVRVRIGPFASIKEATTIQQKVEQLGYEKSKIVIEH